MKIFAAPGGLLLVDHEQSIFEHGERKTIKSSIKMSSNDLADIIVFMKNHRPGFIEDVIARGGRI